MLKCSLFITWPLLQVHMLLLPFLPITALIIQNSTTLNELLQYQTEVQRIGDKVRPVSSPVVFTVELEMKTILRRYAKLLLTLRLT